MSDEVDAEVIDQRTVESTLAVMTEFWRAEESREQSYSTRGGGLVVFSGVVISLTSTVGRGVLRVHLPQALHVVSIVLFVLALCALLTSALVALRGVLAARGTGIAPGEVERYASRAFLSRRPMMVEGEMMRAVSALLLECRELNTSKRRALLLSYGFLAVGLVAVVGLGIILGLHGARVW